jgi:integrase
MVFQAKPGRSFKLRVVDQHGTAATLGTGTPDSATADAMASLVKTFKRRRRWDVLNALVAKRVSLPAVYDAHEAGALDHLLSELATPDLDPLVAEWEKQGANAKYVIQVRMMIPEGIAFPASRFTRKGVSLFLGGLTVQGPTKNRYRTALSQFSRWLVERDVLETNVVRDVAGKPENDPRTVWYEWEDAKRLVDALEEPFKSLEALMAGTGMEWQAIANLKRRDVDVRARTVRAQGCKNRHRNRMVRITEDWTVPIIAHHVRALTPDAPLFTVTNDAALDRHQAAVKALGLEASTLHDWRHTYAVNNLQRGMKPQVVKRQLGHAKNSTMVERIYGVWIVDERDYELTRVAVVK